jgi:hypothetical protein
MEDAPPPSGLTLRELKTRVKRRQKSPLQTALKLRLMMPSYF